MFDVKAPLYNTLIIYIIIVTMLIIIKPEFMYCHDTNEFRTFGYDDGKTLLPFSVVSIASGIFLYMFFSIIESICC